MPEDYRSGFHAQLDELDDAFTAAGLRIVEDMPRLVDAFLEADDAVIEDARLMAQHVGAEARSIEDRGFVLLARHQPMGSDLRRLVALLRMCINIDRSAALLRHVSETVRVCDPKAFPEVLRERVRELAELSSAVYRGGVDAWRTKDTLAVNELDKRDEQVDRLQRVVLETAGEVDVAADGRVVVGLIARYFERIADHGVAIARDTAFTETGERVTLPSKVT